MLVYMWFKDCFCLFLNICMVFLVKFKDNIFILSLEMIMSKLRGLYLSLE